jgi:hypothetical protein
MASVRAKETEEKLARYGHLAVNADGTKRLFYYDKFSVCLLSMFINPNFCLRCRRFSLVFDPLFHVLLLIDIVSFFYRSSFVEMDFRVKMDLWQVTMTLLNFSP